MNSKSLVTGADGHLGNHIVRHLLYRGVDVVAGVKNIAQDEAFNDLSCELIEMDLLESDGLVEQLRGIDIIYHTDEVFKFWSKNAHEDIYDTNMGMSGNLLRAAYKAGIKKIIYTSSALTLDFTQPKLFEKQWNPNRNSVYVRAKMDSERLAYNNAKSYDIEFISLLPSFTIGAPIFTSNPFLDLLKSIFDSTIPIDPNFHLLMVDVRDVAAAAFQASQTGKAGERYLLSSPRGLDIHEILEIISVVGGTKKQPKKVPKFMLKTMVSLWEKKSLITGKAPLFTRDELNLLYGWEGVAGIRKAQKELSFHPRSIEQSLQETYMYFKNRNDISGLPSASPTEGRTKERPSYPVYKRKEVNPYENGQRTYNESQEKTASNTATSRQGFGAPRTSFPPKSTPDNNGSKATPSENPTIDLPRKPKKRDQEKVREILEKSEEVIAKSQEMTPEVFKELERRKTARTTSEDESQKREKKEFIISDKNLEEREVIDLEIVDKETKENVLPPKLKEKAPEEEIIEEIEIIDPISDHSSDKEDSEIVIELEEEITEKEDGQEIDEIFIDPVFKEEEFILEEVANEEVPEIVGTVEEEIGEEDAEAAMEEETEEEVANEEVPEGVGTVEEEIGKEDAEAVMEEETEEEVANKEVPEIVGTIEEEIGEEDAEAAMEEETEEEVANEEVPEIVGTVEEEIGEEDAEAAMEEETEEEVANEEVPEGVGTVEEEIGEEDAEAAIEEETEEEVANEEVPEIVGTVEEEIGEEDAEAAMEEETEEEVANEEVPEVVGTVEEEIGEEDAEAAMEEETEEEVANEEVPEVVGTVEEKIGEEDAEAAIEEETEEEVANEEVPEIVGTVEEKIGEEDAEAAIGKKQKKKWPMRKYLKLLVQ